MSRTPNDVADAAAAWQQPVSDTPRTRFGLYVWRVFIALCFLLAIVLFVVLLYRWLFPDKTHLIVLKASGLSVLDGPPVAVAGTEIGLFEPLRRSRLLGGSVAAYDGPEADAVFKSPAVLGKWISDKVEQLSPRPPASLIVYVAAHGISYDRKAYLVCNNFDPATPTAGLFRIRELLSSLRRVEAETKLLVLDTGHLHYDPALGIVVNDFPRLLRQEVEAANDPHLWVLCSNSDVQRSHKIPSLDASIFGAYVAGGLRGAADRDSDGDDSVTIDELATFVREKVASATDADDQATHQLPVLLHAARDSAAGTTIPGLNSRLLWVGPLKRNPPEPSEDVDHLIRGVAARTAALRGTIVDPVTNERGFLAQLAAPDKPAGPPEAGEPTPVQPDPAAAQTEGEGSQANAAAGDALQAGADAPRAAALRHLRALLEHAWQVRDQLAQPAAEISSSERRPVDATPHLWREAQEELIAHQQLLLGSDPNAVASTQLLQNALAKFWTTQEDRPVLVRDFLQAAGTSRLAPALPVDVSQLKSLAVGQHVAKRFSPQAAPQFEQPAQLLDGLINANPDEFAQKLAELKPTPDLDRFYELRLLAQIVAAGGVEPALAQLALQTRRDGERVAAESARFIAWIESEVEAADRARRAAERHLLDQIGSGWQAKARDLLQQARDRYAAATQIGQTVERAELLRNDMAFRTPYYVRWRGQNLPANEQNANYNRQLDIFLDRLIEFSAVLDAPPQNESIQRLEAIQSAVADAAEKLKGYVDRESNPWKISRLLETPLPSATERREWLRQGVYFDLAGATVEASSLVQGFRPLNSITEEAGSSGSDFPEELLPHYRWEIKLAQLAVGSDATALKRAQDKLDQLTELVTNSASALQANPDQIENEKRNEWEAAHQFGRELRALYAALPARVTAAITLPSALTRKEAHRRIVGAQRALQFLDARDARQLRNVDLVSISRNLYLHDLLAWHATRFALAHDDAPPTEINYLSQAAEDYRGQAKRIYQTDPVAIGSLVEIDVPQRFSLVSRRQRTLNVPVSYRDAGTPDAWVILQYDRDLLEIAAPENVYHEHELPAKIAASLDERDRQGGERISEADRQLAAAYPYRPDLAEMPPTWRGLTRGEPRVLRLELRSRGHNRELAQIIVKTICAPARGNLAAAQSAPVANAMANSNGVSYVRRSIEVPLRVVDLALDAQPNSWQQSGERLILHTFPNRITNYNLGVVNHGTGDREISLRFFAPEAPLEIQTLSDAQVAKVVGRLKPTGQLTIAAAADGAPHFVPAAEPKPAESPSPTAPPAAAAPEAQPAAEPPAGPPLRHGMLVEVSDPKDPRQTYVKQIEIVPQRPRRYVTPQVSYNSRLERIEVVVRPRLGIESLLPPGAVAIECQLAEDSAAQTEGKLRDVLRAPDYEARLFAYVPASPPRLVTLQLHVDGYPRAFVYRVPCGAHAVDVPEQTKLAGLRLQKTQWPDYQPPAAVTPIQAQVDSTVGSFESGGDVVQVALDENMDQLIGPEQGQQLATDRHAVAYLQALGDDGVLALDTRVADHQVALATDRLQNVRVLVHGQLSAARGQHSSEPITLNIDGAAPSVNFVEVSPWGGFVSAGTQLQVAVTASDQMSGVKLVEVGFDLDGTGKFSDKAPPVVAVPDPARYSIDLAANSLSATPSGRSDAALAAGAKPERWIATVPTEGVSGIHTILVRATDHVGLQSEFYGKRVQILTPEQAVARVQQQPKLIQGTVIFRNQPVPGAGVTLLDAESKEIATAQAGSDGQFTLSGVPPGKYAVRGEGVINNVTRFGTQEIVVELIPAPVVRADVRLE